MYVNEVTPGFLSLGQRGARESVLRAAAAGRLQRTLLVHGPAGAGKGAFVDDLLALIMCHEPVVERRPCNACRSCRDARARSHPDLVVGSPDRWREARATGESIVGAARRWLLDGAGTPIAGDKRVILVEGVDRANEQTQNALLKALEEPSARQMFVLVAEDAGRILPTIRSRAQALRVGAVPRAELVAWLVEHERLPADLAEALAGIADGLPGKAIGYARNKDRVEWRRRVQAELLALLERGRSDRFGSVRELLDAAPSGGSSPPDDPPADSDDAPRVSSAAQRGAALAIIDAWQDLARDLLMSAVGRAGLAPAAHLLPDLVQAGLSLQPRELSAFLALLEPIRDGLLQNAAPRLALEAAMLGWPEVPAGRAAAS